jgi:hypothetical protein
MMISDPSDSLSGWGDWLVVAIVLVAFWAIPIAGTLVLFRSDLPASHRKRPRPGARSVLKGGRVQCR